MIRAVRTWLIGMHFMGQGLKALEGVKCQCHAPATLYRRDRPGTRCTGSWVDPWPAWERAENLAPTPGFDPRTVQPLASRYTDYANRPTP